MAEALARQIAGVYDGECPLPPPQPLPAAHFVLMLPLGPDLAGKAYEEVCRAAVAKAAEMAAVREGWPTGEAHVRGLPLSSFTPEFLVTPGRVEVHGDPESLARWEALADRANQSHPALGEALREMGRERCSCGCPECCR